MLGDVSPLFQRVCLFVLLLHTYEVTYDGLCFVVFVFVLSCHRVSLFSFLSVRLRLGASLPPPRHY